jgi:hypothetical protein
MIRVLILISGAALTLGGCADNGKTASAPSPTPADTSASSPATVNPAPVTPAPPLPSSAAPAPGEGIPSTPPTLPEDPQDKAMPPGPVNPK